MVNKHEGGHEIQASGAGHSSFTRRKCAVMGNAAVGKSSIISLFLNPGSAMRKEYEMTVLAELAGTKAVAISNNTTSSGSGNIHLFLHDIAGHSAFRETVPALVKDSHGYIIVYDVTDISSFQAVATWQQLFQSTNGKNSPGALIGMKKDLDILRKVSRRNGEELARKLGLAYFECSALETASAEKDTEAPFNWIANACRDIATHSK